MTDDAQRHAADGLDDVVALLMRQHGGIRNLFDEVGRATGGGRRDAFRRLVRMPARTRGVIRVVKAEGGGLGPDREQGGDVLPGARTLVAHSYGRARQGFVRTASGAREQALDAVREVVTVWSAERRSRVACMRCSPVAPGGPGRTRR
ncbi:hypothetical protein Strvi_3439 [Streptomyces violaceusniger Tu 4113]|uniref:Uncharacterized protein n=1 Tax=Streptomyces violaceusniger (strain Tu 4113) TaxID=653045 RepID=G2NZ69_STRV4|nr:hypothetical protein Strvi_3439 [Streptomyces violaceusniger Tu 4113]